MKILFLGTAAAEGIPAMFCNCEFCNQVRESGSSEFRTRSQVYIDDCLSVDFSPEAYSHSLRFGINFSFMKYVFVTHSHMDHFYAHDFILRGYKYAELGDEKLEIFGNEEVKKVFDECTLREMRDIVLKNIKMNVIEPFQDFYAGEYRIITLPANHNKNENCLLFYIERNGKGYLHLYDTHGLSEKALNFLAEKGVKAQAVSFDCTFMESKTNSDARHMGIYDVLTLKERLFKLNITDNRTFNVITHFSHNSRPSRTRLEEFEKKYGITAAYDGLGLEI